MIFNCGVRSEIENQFFSSEIRIENKMISKGGDGAKIKDEPGSSKAIQKDRNRESEGEEGLRPAYPDKEIGKPEAGSQETQSGRESEYQRS
jgi:hypothetical protein